LLALHLELLGEVGTKVEPLAHAVASLEHAIADRTKARRGERGRPCPMWGSVGCALSGLRPSHHQSAISRRTTDERGQCSGYGWCAWDRSRARGRRRWSV